MLWFFHISRILCTFSKKRRRRRRRRRRILCTLFIFSSFFFFFFFVCVSIFQTFYPKTNSFKKKKKNSNTNSLQSVSIFSFFPFSFPFYFLFFYFNFLKFLYFQTFHSNINCFFFFLVELQFSERDARHDKSLAR